MRTLKFRAWDCENKVMYEPSKNIACENTGFYLDKDEKINSAFIGLFTGLFKPNNLVFMQFTGLHDKNGREIYEGDIVRKGHYRYGLNPTNELIGVVSYEVSPDGCRFVLNPHRYGPSLKDGCTGCPMDIEPDLEFYNSRTEPEKQADLIEVIGNIYENPELLKGDA